MKFEICVELEIGDPGARNKTDDRLEQDQEQDLHR